MSMSNMYMYIYIYLSYNLYMYMSVYAFATCIHFPKPMGLLLMALSNFALKFQHIDQSLRRDCANKISGFSSSPIQS